MPDPIASAVAAALAPLSARAGAIGVACSGGADSLVLADAVIEAAGAERVVVLVIDHGLHPDSAAVARRVVAWGEGAGAAAVAERVAVAPAGSLEAAARDARYAALDRLAERLGLGVVLLGHTARDQAETVLLRILRGTGPAGLAAIPPQRGRFERPFLALDRRLIEERAAARGLPVWEDPMNADVRHARARVRHELLPHLREVNPKLDAALIRLAGIAAEWREAIDGLAATLLASAGPLDAPLDCRTLAAAPAAVRKRALQLALEAGGVGHGAVHLEALDRLVTAPSRGEVCLDLPGGRAVRSYDTLTLSSGAAGQAAPATDLTAPVGPYVLRRWRPGDRMRPARLAGRSRKLSDLYTDAKVPRIQRPSARVVERTTDGAIVWAEHVGLAFGERENCLPSGVTGPTQKGGIF
ncbi:MAG: tRNA lysidine(34) synthetase TilS [Deltaproteobacteria bacterium]|nr:tRNA lysidine(34) synthetase TilS [Deltaproteobacteria bacterium]